VTKNLDTMPSLVESAISTSSRPAVQFFVDVVFGSVASLTTV